ncbi:uncharacterized protein FTOL_11366 [Fusarium torulosum]|uniref:Major facilitator superfamily (MFS) profile domain-containing protein n=1 Tax=Fusarium torulosum TaxID=33205 RepID=A0AAE8SMY5_9HYPO|nr:uncharacterized protein FTOL_11366 [Fusarium torulosum]
MLISFIIWTICSARFETSPSNGLSVAVIFIYFFHYDIAYTPLVLAYPTEILQYSIRSKGLSLTFIAIYSSLVILSFVNPIALEAIGWKYYIVFCWTTGVSVVVNFLLLPETKGLSLEEIEGLFRDKDVVNGADGSAKLEGGEVSHVDVKY